MKKIIITIIAIATMMSLASCGGKAETTVTSGTIEENIIEETVTTENIIEETIEWTLIEFEGKSFTNVKMTRSEMDRLMDGYSDGKYSKEYVEETLFNSQSNRW